MVVNRKLCLVVFVFLVGALWVSASHSSAADAPNTLQPAPTKAQSIPQPPTEVKPLAESLHEEAVAAEDEPCDDGCNLEVCSPSGRVWLRADYLMWWTNGMNLPPLVTTGPLGSRQTAILYGDGTINDDGRSGFRTTIGLWIDACHMWGLEFDYLNLGERANNYYNSSTGNPILARPYLNVYTNAQDADVVAYPVYNEGSISVEAKDYFQSAGFLVSYNLCSCNFCGDSCGGACNDSCGESCTETCGQACLSGCRSDLLMGFRYYNLSDYVGIHEITRNIYLNTTYNIQDIFRARNDFYGSEIGVRTQVYHGRWSMEILGRIAVGNTHQTVNINGQTTMTTSQGTTQANVGLLALPNPPANIGTYHRDVFTMIPQLGIELGYQLSCHWRTYVGYNVLYWGSVSRAADQIDLNVDPRNQSDTPTGLPFPAYTYNATTFWAQGVNVGLERRF